MKRRDLLKLRASPAAEPIVPQAAWTPQPFDVHPIGEHGKPFVRCSEPEQTGACRDADRG